MTIRNPACTGTYRALLFLIYAAPVLVVAVWAWKRQSSRSVVATLLTAALIAMLFGAITRSWRRFFLVQFLFFLLSVVFMTYTLLFSMPPGQTLATIVVGTSTEEILGFIKLPEGREFLLFLLATSACYLYLAWKMPKELPPGRLSTRTRYSALGILFLTTVYAAWNPAELVDGIALNPLAGSFIFLGSWVPLAASQVRGSGVHKIPYHATRRGGEEVHVLIIGESERRASWSAYGYDRATTPFMDKIKNEVIFLHNASADANLTAWAVPILLTGLTPEEYDISHVRGSIVDLANEAGYHTAWLDNQDIGVSAIVGVTANFTVNPADFHADINGRHTFDEVLLPAYRREIASSGKPRFICIHMMGTHWEYYRRYPSKFQHFGSSKELTTLSIFFGTKKSFSDVVDSYDNAVLYTDWFLHEVIEQARGLKVPTTVTFFSDHGEDLQLLDGEAGHGQPIYTPHAFDVPAFVWVNDAFRSAHPDLVKAMQQNADKDIRSHNVFDTEGQLMGITWTGSQIARSWSSTHFVADSEMKRVAGGVLVAPH